MNYDRLIYKIKTNNYQNYLNLNKRFYNSYISSRSFAICKLKKSKKNKSIIINEQKKLKIFRTYYDLNLIYQKFIKFGDLDQKSHKIVYKLYKKFETRLILRENYLKNLGKNSKKKANLNSYVLLAFLIRKLHNLNLLQKINSIIKISDHLITNKFIPANSEIRKIFIGNLKYEINQISKLNKT